MTGAALDQGTTTKTGYNPTKEERKVRRKVYERFWFMRDDPLRKEAEADWEEGDRMFGQYVPTPDTDDWRAHLVLPDAFAAIQAHMQETIERNSRPYLRRVEDSDKGVETFQNSVLAYNLNRTGFDYQYFLAKYSAAIRGTAYLVDFFRVDKRKIQDPVDVNADGTLKYQEKEITDFDDDYTQWVPNEFIYLDPNAKTIEEALDYVRREILDVDEFKRSYGFRKDFVNLEFVMRGGDTSIAPNTIFKMPHDMNENQVEVLHYVNRAEDQYYVVANNVTVRTGPIPNKHKELDVTPVYHYMVPGRMYGLGVPKVINALSQERASIRNLNLDRQKMQINKMYLINDQVDFDEEELITRPHGFVEVSTNGLSIRDAVQPLEYGDVPGSAYKTEEILQEDIRRATGIDDRIQGVQTGGTATEASFLRESSQKRINLIAKIAEMDAIKRIGRLKWSNIQFFYPAPKVERITEENDEREKKVYRKVQVDGKEFTVTKDNGKTALKVNDIEGSTTFKLDPKMARFMEGDYDVTIDAESVNVVSKALQQAKITEMVAGIASVPNFLAEIDPRKALARILDINMEQAKNWLRGDGKTPYEWQHQAQWENRVMATGTVLSPTDDATTEHTMEHLNYTETAEFGQLPPEIQAIFMQHITGEHDKNPATGMSADLMGGAPAAPGGGAPAPVGGGGLPNVQPSDLTPSTVTGEQPNSSQNQ